MTTTHDIIDTIMVTAVLLYAAGMLSSRDRFYRVIIYGQQRWDAYLESFTTAENQNIHFIQTWGGVGLTWLSWGATVLFVRMYVTDPDAKVVYAKFMTAVWCMWTGISAYIAMQGHYTTQGKIVNTLLTIGMALGWLAAWV